MMWFVMHLSWRIIAKRRNHKRQLSRSRAGNLEVTYLTRWGLGNFTHSRAGLGDQDPRVVVPIKSTPEASMNLVPWDPRHLRQSDNLCGTTKPTHGHPTSCSPHVKDLLGVPSSRHATPKFDLMWALKTFNIVPGGHVEATVSADIQIWAWRRRCARSL